jgi:Domain of unknown function (DUF4476)
MKNILLVICSFVLVINSFAQNNSNITISTTGNNNLKIRFDGKQYSLLDRSVTFQNIQPGNHTIVIYQLQRKNNGTNDFVEVYNNTITLIARKHLEVSVLRFGKVAMDENFMESDNWNEGSYNPRNNNQGNNYSGVNSGVVTDQQFVLLKKAVIDAVYDDEKLSTGKVILKNNLFTAPQIKELCKLFIYDDRRLDFAKFAYDYCAEKGIYITVLDTFIYPSNKTALLNFIRNK